MITPTKNLIAFLSTILFIFVLGCTISSVFLSTLENNKEEISGETTSISELPNKNIYEYIDPQTGVHYLIYSCKSGNAGMGGITPRLNADGTVMVSEIKKE